MNEQADRIFPTDEKMLSSVTINCLANQFMPYTALLVRSAHSFEI